MNPSRRMKFRATLALALMTATATAEVGPTLTSTGPLTFGPDGVVFVADTMAATIYAMEIGELMKGGQPGTADVPGLDAKLAAMLGTEASEILIADIAVDPTTRNTLISVSRGRGEGAQPILMRVDGAGEIEALALDAVKFTQASLPNAPDSVEGRRGNPRNDSVTDMAFVEGKLFIAGLSNEEFASTLRSVAYPFRGVGPGAGIEIYHGAHGALETHSPVYTFVPYKIDNEDHLIAGYLCTPLVRLPVKDLTAGAKVRGVTIAELGNGNRPIDMIVYKKDGKDFLLMSNTSRGVMKIPTAEFGTQTPITERVPRGQTLAGVPYETVEALAGVEQLDRLDDARAIVIARDASGLHLKAVDLP